MGGGGERLRMEGGSIGVENERALEVEVAVPVSEVEEVVEVESVQNTMAGGGV